MTTELREKVRRLCEFLISEELDGHPMALEILAELDQPVPDHVAEKQAYDAAIMRETGKRLEELRTEREGEQ